MVGGVQSTPAGPHVGHQRAQEVEIRTGSGIGERLLETLLGHKQDAFGVLTGEGDAAVVIHHPSHCGHELAGPFGSLQSQVVPNQRSVLARRNAH